MYVHNAFSYMTITRDISLYYINTLQNEQSMLVCELEVKSMIDAYVFTCLFS